ncbi:putative transcriptional regulatory protein [Tolypocladium ophioglossoides CBS 100239]|uniref:Putative transcriptional regulatory protein n=1 Tax=Tolypocladium ophioglossoides (strain CBS 100239) TaxID=1163406 RepID=A0A0L0NKJ1_TOLOC|nr:putative transcriptional regulatory protein [Tolypocladium ophioglossoides CBS 100239]
MDSKSLPFSQSRPETTLTVSDQDLRIWSCVTCRRRKVKCDRRDPCANCLKSNIECHFPVTGRLPRRSQDPAALKSPSQRQSELLGRLRRLESLVTELTGQVEDGPLAQSQLSQAASARSSGLATDMLQPLNAWRPAAPASSDSSAGDVSTRATQSTGEVYEDFGRLAIDQGRGMRVNNGFWSIFCGEVEHIFQAIEDVSDGPEGHEGLSGTTESQNTRESSANSRCHGYVFGTPCAFDADSAGDLYPLPSQVPFIWKTYVENVDPLIKVLHTPSVDHIISQARGKFGTLGLGTEALLFAIGLAAITSLDEEDVSESFRVSKSELISRYRTGTERALGRSQFLTTRDITVVQALAIYVSILPHIGAQQEAASLAAVLLRIATRLGLHRDISTCTPTSLEVETRRRLWWQICFIESRSRDSNLPGLSVSEDSFDTKPPANANDKDIRAGSIILESHESRHTQMMLTLIRCEIWRLHRTLRRNQDKTLHANMKILHEIRSKVEGSYLQHLDVEDAFQSFTETMTSLFFAKVEQAIYRQHLRRSDAQDPHVRGLYFASSIATIEAMRDLKTDPAWNKWRWQLQGHFPWHAVGAVFIQLCQLSWTPVSERAWNMARGLFDELPHGSRKDDLWQRLSELATRASIYRDGHMARPGETTSQGLRGRYSAGGIGQVSLQPSPLPLQGLSTSGDTSVATGASVAASDVGDTGSALGGSWEKMSAHVMSDLGGDVTLSSIIKDVLEENGGAAEHELYAVGEVPGGWQDWDDLAGIDMY